ncbi:hypothetical protein MBANPS3_006433 [Mucor bainieri]
MDMDWANVNKLAKIHVHLSAEASLKRWVKIFKHVSKAEPCGAVAIYAFEVATFLETFEAEALYKEAYELECSNKTLKRRTDAVYANTRKVMKLKAAQELNQEEKESIAVLLNAPHADFPSASSLAGSPSTIHTRSAAGATDTDYTGLVGAPVSQDGSSSSSSATPVSSKKCLRHVSIKKKLFNDAQTLHGRTTKISVT